MTGPGPVDATGSTPAGTAAVLGASGAWGRAVALDLLRRGWDVVAVGRSDVPELRAWAARLSRGWSHLPYDLLDVASPCPTLPAVDALFVCTAVTEGDRATLVRGNYLAPAALVGSTVARMRERGAGRIGIFVGQNARLGLAGAADFSASQAALWTWCEALAEELRRDGRGVRLTRVIPPRTASDTQRYLSKVTGRTARVRPPAAAPIVAAVLAGRPHAGRRPIAAALAMLVR